MTREQHLRNVEKLVDWIYAKTVELAPTALVDDRANQEYEQLYQTFRFASFVKKQLMNMKD